MTDSEADSGSEPSPFGEWLSDTRVKKGWTPQQLADESGVTMAQIYNIESGRTQNPQAKTREKLAKALGSQPSAETVQATEQAAAIVGLGSLTDFDPHNDALLPPEPGVYVFYDISQRPIYVGQSQNIRNRIKQDHIDRFWYRAPIVQYAAYVKVAEEAMRKQLEMVLIKFLKANAVVNQQGVDRG